MPNKVKAGISLLVAAAAAGMFFYQRSLGFQVNQWIAVALAAVMILALWLFPEAKARAPQDPQKPER
jgi:hypothetical protein